MSSRIDATEVRPALMIAFGLHAAMTAAESEHSIKNGKGKSESEERRRRLDWFEELRRAVMRFAEAQGYRADEDVFEEGPDAVDYEDYH